MLLRNSRWDWEKRRQSGEQLGLGMYPHFEVSDTAAMIEKARRAGYRIVQEPRKYDFGTESGRYYPTHPAPLRAGNSSLFHAPFFSIFFLYC